MFDHDLTKHSFDDQPFININGDKVWYQFGLIHRETDAAIIRHDGYKQFFLDNEEYPFETWIKLTPISEFQKIELILKYG